MIQRRVTIFCKLAIFWVVMVSGENFNVRAPKCRADYKQSKTSWRRSKCYYRYHLYYLGFKMFLRMGLLLRLGPNVITDGTFITLGSNYYTCAFYSRFVNSGFPNKKNLSQNRSLFTTHKFESKCLQKFYVSSKLDKECFIKTTPYLEEPSRHFCQHFMWRRTQQTFSAINLASQQKTTKLSFSSQIRKQFKLLTVPLKPLRCCLPSDKLVNSHVWKFYKDLLLNFHLDFKE